MTQTSPAIRAGTEPDGPGTEPTEERAAWQAYDRQYVRFLWLSGVSLGYGVLAFSYLAYQLIAWDWAPPVVSALIMVGQLFLVNIALQSNVKVQRRRFEWWQAFGELETNALVERARREARREAILHMLLRAKLN